MTWRKYSAVAQPDTFAVNSSSRVSGMKPSFFLRLGPVRGSSEARTQMTGSSGTAGKGGRGAATHEFKRTQQHHGARAAFDPPSTLQEPTQWPPPPHPPGP